MPASPVSSGRPSEGGDATAPTDPAATTAADGPVTTTTATATATDDGRPDDAGPVETTATDDTTPDDAVRARGLPLWFESALLLVVLGVVCCGGFGLLLAVTDHYSARLSIGVGVPVAVVLTLLGVRGLAGRAGERPVRRGTALPTVLAVVVTALQVAWNGIHAGSWLNVDRDPGTYAVAAKWLTQHSGLVVDYTSAWAGTGLTLRGEGPSVYDMGGGRLEFQFNHLLAVLLAQAGAIGGDRALLAGNAVLTGIGLLAVYAVGVRLTGRPWIALVASVVLGLALPVVFISRATFSEGVTMQLIWTGTWLLLLAWDRAPALLGVLAGLCLGASAMARIDALVYLLVLPLLAVVAAWGVRREGGRRRVIVLSVAVLVGAALPVALGTVDVVYRAGRYYADLQASIVPLQKASVATLVVGVLGLLLAVPGGAVVRRVGDRLAPRAATVAGVVGLAVIAALVLDWTARPALFPQRGTLPNSTVLLLQQAEGLTPDPFRTYSEQEMTWLGWYLGVPFLCFAVVGLGLLVYRAVRGAVAPLVLLSVFGAGTAYYLYDLSNTPDQLFGPRRFVPGLLPLFVVAGAVAVAAVADLLPRVDLPRLRRLGAPLIAGVLAVVLVFQVSTVWRVRDMSPRQGMLATVDSVCDQLGSDAIVLFPYADYGFQTYPPTLRSFCDIPVAATLAGPSVAQVRSAAGVLADRGQTLWVLDNVADRLTTVYGASAVVDLGTTVNPLDPGVTLTRPPLTYSVWTSSWYGVKVTP